MYKFFVACSLFLLMPLMSLAATEQTILIQPGPDEGKDTYFGNVNGKEGRPDSFEFRIGGWGDTWVSYLEFDISEVPKDSEIVSAKLGLFNRVEGNPNEAKLFLVTEPWSESEPTFYSSPSFVDVGKPYLAVPNLDWLYFDVTSEVQDWISDVTPNYGWRIQAKFNSNWHVKHFISSDNVDDPSLRPLLEITYLLKEKAPKTVHQSVSDLEEYISNLVSATLQQSYAAQVKKLVSFFDTGKYTAALQQMKALFTKVENDIDKGKLEPEIGQSIIETGTIVEDLIEEAESSDKAKTVPLMTQVASPYPPESATWASHPYAAGRANYEGSCGQTIAQCGCALASFTMLGQGYGLTQGVDGSAATPPNIDAWLLANNGYDAVGNINWMQAVKYFGNATIPNSTYLAYDKIYTDERNLIDSHLTKNGPVIVKTRATNRNGLQFTHFILGTDKQGQVYGVRDPLWYNTVNLDDVRDRLEWVQDYNNRIDGGLLLTFSKEPVLATRGIELHLASPAELVLTDSEGRRLGRNPLTGEVFNEIPGGVYYEEEAVFSEELAESGVQPHVTKVLAVSAPLDDVYTLEVIGTGSGSYYLSNLTIAGSGDSTFFDVRDTTELGQIDEFVINVEMGDGELLAIIERIRSLVVGQSDYQWLFRRLDVLEDKVEKENLIAAESQVAALLMQMAARSVDDIELLAELETLKVALGE